MLFHLTLIKFSRSDYLLMNLPLVTLTSIIRTRYSILVELIVLKSSVTILIRGLAFLLRSLSKTLVTLGPALLNLFFSDASICFTAFLSLGNQILCQFLLSFPSNTRGLVPFHRKDCQYFRVDWDGLCNNLRGVLWEDIFRLGASAADTEFCKKDLVGIDVCIPHYQYQVKSYLSLQFLAFCAAATSHRNHLIFLY